LSALAGENADEAEPAASSDSDDSDEDQFLSQLAQALAGPPTKRPCVVRSMPELAADHSRGIALGPADWPVEVKSAVASFLPWRELPRAARISQGWRVLERSDALWKEYFRIQWPRFFHRKKAAHPQGGVPWRALFRQRWAEPNRDEDAEQEDWNDFSAALDLWKGSPKSMPKDKKSISEEQLIQFAVMRFKEDALRLRSLKVPVSPLERGALEHKCRHRPVPIAGKLDGCLFVCELCADVHVCRPMVPCDGSVLNSNNLFLVCTVSGRCVDSGRTLTQPSRPEDGVDVAENHWDPELSAAQQHGRWFEQGYSMDEETADDFFDNGSGRASRKRRLRPGGSGGGSGGSNGQVSCQHCC